MNVDLSLLDRPKENAFIVRLKGDDPKGVVFELLAIPESGVVIMDFYYYQGKELEKQLHEILSKFEKEHGIEVQKP
jgi:hypothetical protein